MLRKRFVREKMEVSLSDIVKVFIFLLVTLYLYKNLGILFAGAKKLSNLILSFVILHK